MKIHNKKNPKLKPKIFYYNYSNKLINKNNHKYNKIKNCPMLLQS
jgi:hypothetical protein